MLGPPNDVIQSLWIGDRLSPLEQLTIKSFLANGHYFNLYTYGPVEGIPQGTTVLDGNAIVPFDDKIVFKDFPESKARFADIFRYELLLTQGGWWVDMDMICLKPFDIERANVFASGTTDNEGLHRATNCAMKVPKHSEITWYCLKESRQMGEVYWGATGPRLLDYAIDRFERRPCIEPPRAFCPFPGWQCLLDTGITYNLENVYGVHMWNELWRREGIDKFAKFPSDSLFEKLKERYDVR